MNDGNDLYRNTISTQTEETLHDELEKETFTPQKERVVFTVTNKIVIKYDASK